MDTLNSAEMQPRPLSPVFQFPGEVKSAQARKQHKHRVLRESPETLIADCFQAGENTVTTNLLLFTEHTDAWHTAICKMYVHVKKGGICQGRQLKIREDADSDHTVFTVNLYQNGTIMIQGSEASLVSFEKNFLALKELAESAKPKSQNTGTPTAASPVPDSTQPARSTDSTAPVPTVPAEESTVPGDSQHLLTQPPELHSTVAIRKASLSLLEVELTELRELVRARLTESDITQQLKDQTSQIKNEYKASFRELKAEVKELQQDRETLRRELTGLREELQHRDKTVQSLREQLHTLTVPHSPAGGIATQTAQCPPAPACKDTLTHTHSTPAKHTDTPTHTHTDNTDSPPARHTGNHTKPDTHTTHTNSTQNTPNTHADPGTAPTPSGRPAAKHRNTEIALLMDSNGKYIDEKWLFPKHTVSKIWCPTTEKALEALSPNTATGEASTSTDHSTAHRQPGGPPGASVHSLDNTTGTCPAQPSGPRSGPASPFQHPAQPSQQQAHSYAAALSRPAGTGSTELEEIHHLLNLICTRLMS
ncbi:UNVERIFIED_CONTAM: hypothetical protein FKN15_034653 [Acipenser sinensis]